MAVEIIQTTDEHERWRDWHILTVAEDGFSMLTHYACDGLHAHDRDTIRKFADTVNERNEAGSLHPQVPISALPRRFFRDIDNIDIGSYEHTRQFKKELNAFVRTNRQTIHARKLMVDFHVCAALVPQHYIEVLDSVFNTALNNGDFDEVVLIA